MTMRSTTAISRSSPAHLASRLTKLRISRGRNARRSEFYGPLFATDGQHRAKPRTDRARQLHAPVRRQPPTTCQLPRLLWLGLGRRPLVAGGATGQSPREKPGEIWRFALPLRAQAGDDAALGARFQDEGDVGARFVLAHVGP